MLRLSNSIRFLMLTLLFSVAAIPAHADGISNPMYSITGVLILTGNNTCTPAPCSEAIAFSFDLGYKAETDCPLCPTDYFAYATNATEIWTGDIASVTVTSPTLGIGVEVPAVSGGCSGADTNYIGLFDPGGDEADVHLCDNDEPTPVVPSLSWGDLYRCQSSACANGFPYGAINGVGILEDVTVTQIPEPPTFVLLASGMLALGLLGATHRRFLSLACSGRAPQWE